MNSGIGRNGKPAIAQRSPQESRRFPLARNSCFPIAETSSFFLPYARRFRDMGFPLFRTVDGMPHEFSGSAHRDVALPVPFFFKPGAS
jgi:hypothetical protein